MARIRLKLGEDEIEVDSRDIYVDNQTLGDVIDGLSQYLSDSRAKIVYAVEEALADESISDEETMQPETEFSASSEELPDASRIPVLGMLDEAEVYEPEFTEPENITAGEIPSKLLAIGAAGFFDTPRTVTETVQHLRENGWAASRLDVSKAMVLMATGKRLVKDSDGNHVCYVAARRPLLVS